MALKINSLKSYCSIESYGSLVDPRNLIHEMYRGEITLKIFFLKNYPVGIYKQLFDKSLILWFTSRLATFTLIYHDNSYVAFLVLLNTSIQCKQ